MNNKRGRQTVLGRSLSHTHSCNERLKGVVGVVEAAVLVGVECAIVMAAVFSGGHNNR